MERMFEDNADNGKIKPNKSRKMLKGIWNTNWQSYPHIGPKLRALWEELFEAFKDAFNI